MCQIYICTQTRCTIMHSYYIHTPEIMKLIFTFYMSRAISITRCCETECFFYIYSPIIDQTVLFVLCFKPLLDQFIVRCCSSEVWSHCLCFRRMTTINHSVCGENFQRFGRNKDGGYDICMTSSFRPLPENCLVYSFG